MQPRRLQAGNRKQTIYSTYIDRFKGETASFVPLPDSDPDGQSRTITAAYMCRELSVISQVRDPRLGYAHINQPFPRANCQPTIMAPLHPSSRHRRQLGLSPNSQSYTLDDSSPQITYTVSFPTAQVPPNCAQTSTCTYQNTLHQTSSAAGSASFKFTASQIYIYGVKGPGFGSFSVTIDGIP